MRVCLCPHLSAAVLSVLHARNTRNGRCCMSKIKTVPCPCTTIAQDETCPVGYPSLLCEDCDGKGHLPGAECLHGALHSVISAYQRVRRSSQRALAAAISSRILLDRIIRPSRTCSPRSGLCSSRNVSSHIGPQCLRDAMIAFSNLIFVGGGPIDTSARGSWKRSKPEWPAWQRLDADFISVCAASVYSALSRYREAFSTEGAQPPAQAELDE